ncbi:putative receptor-like protein kinase At5g20050 [Silene latifolia]|uniref:putative receptor-like protein kinase At5g20050 n=1 Tax=Silene latifolia TaxID=37657 RepID=UPI003D78346C
MDETKLRLVAISLLTVMIMLVVVFVIFLKSSWIFFTILGIVVAGSFGVLVWFFTRYQKWSSENRTSGDGISSIKRRSRVLTKYSYKDLTLATDDFSTIVGQGGSGSVYKGVFKDGTHVAVKRLDGQEHGERVFRAEMAAIGWAHHRNLVRLYGYCIVPRGPRFLVYEFVPNGSLDRWIFPRKPSKNHASGCLSWKLRYKVAIDVARALYYLHNDCQSRILHLDVKPENILIDENFFAVVSDFGLAKLMGKEEKMVVTRIRGTREYLAPEWILDHGVSAKSDVYSYGLVLLEMIGGRRNVNSQSDMISSDYFPKIVFDKMKAGKLMEVVDKRVLEKGNVVEEEVKKMVYVALWCIQEKVILRPNMGQVVNMLEGHLPVTEPPESNMFFLNVLLYNNTEKVQVICQ